MDRFSADDARPTMARIDAEAGARDAEAHHDLEEVVLPGQRRA
jgi:hypothetical protein